MAIKRLILHLGMPKAGSTSIQHALFSNSAMLEKNGFRYLTEWGENHLIVLRQIFSPHPVEFNDKYFFNILTEEDRKKFVKNKINAMLEVSNTTTCESLILSGEYFIHLSIDSTNIKIKDFLVKYFQSKNVETKIICLVRNPLTWMISSHQQSHALGTFKAWLDYFDERIRMYNGIFNLKRYFADSLILLKFEDAISDKDGGLVGCFLKTIGYPKEEINKMNVSKMNESRCMEAVELGQYIEDLEPFAPLGRDKNKNPNRIAWDLRPLKNVKGAKYDLPLQGKMELWERLKETVLLLKEKTGIDYTDYKITPSPEQDTYNEETIQGFIEAFPKLSPILQKLFLKFFEKKYAETAQVKFKRLFSEESIPWKMYTLEGNKREKNILLNSRICRITKILSKMKTVFKRIMYGD